MDREDKMTATEVRLGQLLFNYRVGPDKQLIEGLINAAEDSVTASPESFCHTVVEFLSNEILFRMNGCRK